MWILMLVWIWVGDPSSVLVLRNGKTLNCDSFEVKDRTVHVLSGGQTFSLPESAIDWAKTEAAASAKASREPKAAEEPSDRVPSGPRKARGKPIVLTNDQLKPQRGASAVTVDYRMLSNNVVIQVSINGDGPFDIILDTGASLSVIDPVVISRLKIPLTSRTIPMVGVGGAVASPTAIIGELSVGRAHVKNLEVAAHAIAALSGSGTIGLLGQDYLNHFVMKLDSARKKLTLTPHATSHEVKHIFNMSPSEIQELIETNEQRQSDFKVSIDRLGSIYSTFRSSGGARIEHRQTQTLAEISRDLNEVRHFCSEAYRLISGVPLDELDASQRTKAQALVTCYKHYDRFLRELVSFAQILRRVSSSGGRAVKERDWDNLDSKLEGAGKRLRDFEACR